MLLHLQLQGESVSLSKLSYSILSLNPFTTENAPLLKKIHLSYIDLSMFNVSSYFPSHLCSLSIHESHLPTTLDLHQYTQLKQLSIIHSMQLRYVICPLTITKIQLTDGHLKEFPLFTKDEYAITSMELQSLELTYHKITTIPTHCFQSMRHLIHLNISHNQLRTLPGKLFMYCSCLKTLSVQYNHLKYLPLRLPSTLTEFNCSHNLLTRLPVELPFFLKELNCSYNQLHNLPSILPSYLMKLYCNHNCLERLSSELPYHLTYLDCSNNHLITSPRVYPGTLQYLNCSHNCLHFFNSRTLPLTLQFLYMQYNKIRHLHYLPPSLSFLNCSHNQLSSFPNQFPPHMIYFQCQYNRLTTLPSQIPLSMKRINCSHNRLLKLPYFQWDQHYIYRYHCQDNDALHIRYPPSLTLPQLYRFYRFLWFYYCEKYGRRLLYFLLRQHHRVYKKDIPRQAFLKTRHPDQVSRFIHKDHLSWKSVFSD